MTKLQETIGRLPEGPGVYKFIGSKNQILYIGKATSLKNRVKSYFIRDLIDKRSPIIGKMMEEAQSIKFEKTDSVLEALILEAELIKKHLPPYNTIGKDQKTWNYVIITDEKILINGKPYEYIFSRRNRAPALHYIRNNVLQFEHGFTIKEPDLLQEKLKAEDPDEDSLEFNIKPPLPKLLKLM